MTAADLVRLAATGEGPALEFKQRVPRPARLAKEVVAFANTDGGRVLVGVNDDTTVVGLRDAEEEEFALRHALDTFVDPPLAYTIAHVPIPATQRDVLVIDVPPSPARPHFVVEPDVPPQAYVRVGASSVEASREAVKLMRRGPDDARGVRFEFGDKEALLMRYLDAYGRITVAGFAQIAGVPVRQARHTLVLLTRAGVLVHHIGAREDAFTLSLAA